MLSLPSPLLLSFTDCHHSFFFCLPACLSICLVSFSLVINTTVDDKSVPHLSLSLSKQAVLPTLFLFPLSLAVVYAEEGNTSFRHFQQSSFSLRFLNMKNKWKGEGRKIETEEK